MKNGCHPVYDVYNDPSPPFNVFQITVMGQNESDLHRRNIIGRIVAKLMPPVLIR